MGRLPRRTSTNFANHQRCQRAEEPLETRTQGFNESVTAFVEDVLRLSASADPQAIQEKKLHILMRGVKDNILGGLVRNPPTSVEAFVTEAEARACSALQARASHYHRHSSIAASELGNDISPSFHGIRSIIREVVREELRKILPTADSTPSLSLAEIVWEEVQQALQPDVPADTAPAPPT